MSISNEPFQELASEYLRGFNDGKEAAFAEIYAEQARTKARRVVGQNSFDKCENCGAVVSTEYQECQSCGHSIFPF